MARPKKKKKTGTKGSAQSTTYLNQPSDTKAEMAGSQTPKQKSKLAKFMIWVGYISTVVTILGAITYVSPYKELFWPKKTDPVEVRKIDTGTLRAPVMRTYATPVEIQRILNMPAPNDSYPKVHGIFVKNLQNLKGMYFEMSGLVYGISLQELYEGWRIHDLFPKFVDSNFIILAKGDSIYISMTINYLETEETIGVIEFNHWRLWTDRLLTYSCDDSSLEVKDNKNRIALSLRLYQQDQPIIHLNGYQITDTRGIVFLTDPLTGQAYGLDPFVKKGNWKDSMSSLIRRIKPLFLVHHPCN